MGFEWDRRDSRAAPAPSPQQRAEEPCWAACPLQTELLMLLPGGMNSGFSHPSEPVLVCCPYAPVLCGAACPRATGTGAPRLPPHPAPHWARRTARAGKGSSWERQCPFLLPAMQTETEKDQIPKFLFKPRCRGPRRRCGDHHLPEGLVAGARKRSRATMALQPQAPASVLPAAASQGPKRGCAGPAPSSARGDSPTK